MGMLSWIPDNVITFQALDTSRSRRYFAVPFPFMAGILNRLKAILPPRASQSLNTKIFAQRSNILFTSFQPLTILSTFPAYSLVSADSKQLTGRRINVIHFDHGSAAEMPLD
jgi:hypothetical protein